MIPLDYNVISTPIVEFTRRMLGDTPPGMRRTYASAGDTGLRLRDVALGGNPGMYPKLTIGDKVPDFRFKTPWDDEVKFYDAVGNNPAVLIFLRYYGCPVCQMEMAKIKQEIDLVRQKGGCVFVTLQCAGNDCIFNQKRRFPLHNYL